MGTGRQVEAATPSDREVVITRAFDASRELVFDAFVRPDLFSRWLLGPPGWTMPVCELDPREGGALRVVWRGADGTEMGLRGIYREVVRPERIVHTEVFDQDWTGSETLVTTAFAEREGRTTVAMTILYVSRDARDAALRVGMERGLAASYDRLDGLLDGTAAGRNA